MVSLGHPRTTWNTLPLWETREGKSGLTVGDESLALAARRGVGWEVGREGALWNRGSAAAEVGKLDSQSCGRRLSTERSLA